MLQLARRRPATPLHQALPAWRHPSPIFTGLSKCSCPRIGQPARAADHASSRDGVKSVTSLLFDLGQPQHERPRCCWCAAPMTGSVPSGQKPCSRGRGGPQRGQAPPVRAGKGGIISTCAPHWPQGVAPWSLLLALTSRPSSRACTARAQRAFAVPPEWLSGDTPSL